MLVSIGFIKNKKLMALSSGLEPELLASEANALSIELRELRLFNHTMGAHALQP